MARRAGAFLLRAATLLAVLFLALAGLGPRSGHYRVLTVLSGSMRPTLPIGSLVVVTPAPIDSVAPGQVITYARPLPDHQIVTHRVMSVTHEHGHPVVLTKGDNNAAADPWTAELNGTTLWRARAVVPGAGSALALMRARWLAKMWMLVPVLLAISWLMQIWSPSPAIESPAAPKPSPPTRTSPRGLQPWIALGAVAVVAVAATVERKPPRSPRGWLRV